MIKFLGLKTKLSLICIGLCLPFLISCEKDTGDVGLGTLPSEDGFYVYQDSINITGFTTVFDTRLFTEDPASILIGSAVLKIDEDVYDTITAECDVPLFFPQNPGEFQNIINATSISLVFKDYGFKSGGYKFGDTLRSVPIDIIGRYNGQEHVIASFDYSYLNESGYRKSDTVTIPLNNDLLEILVTGIKNTLQTFPLMSDGYYSNDSILDVKKYFFANYFQGLKFRVSKTSDAFISRIFNPYILIEYKNESVITQEFLLQRYDLAEVDTVAIQEKMFVYPGAIFSHTSNMNNTKGILVQGGAAYRTLIDMSPIASWKDSTALLVNKALLKFELDPIDETAPIDYLRLTMYNKADKTSISTKDKKYNDSLNAYFFEINEMLNTFISNGLPLENYDFELACPTPNTTVNKSRLKYKDGVKLNVVYSKY